MSIRTRLAILAISSLGALGAFNALANAADGDTLVVFTTNWSASSRGVLPIVRDVASQNGVKVDQIDVDAQDAPSRSQKYGIGIPKGSMPQVFVVRNKRATKVYDGGAYRDGDEDTVRSTLLQGLQGSR
jgi:ABC-type glycerol-3-phosphate transport system substrate-binding protein